MNKLKFQNSDKPFILYVSPSYFPDGRTPVPDVLTEPEAIRFLRLDMCKLKNPYMTMKYYRAKGLIRAVRLSKRNFYTKTELLRFLDDLTNGKAA